MGEKRTSRYNYQYGSTAHNYEHAPQQTPAQIPVRRRKQVKKQKFDFKFAVQVSACTLKVYS